MISLNTILSKSVLQESLEFQKNVDISPSILWITDAEGKRTFLSKQWYELTGQAIGSGLGFRWLEAIHPADKVPTGKFFIESNAKQEPFCIEYRVRTKNGDYRWAIDAGNPRYNEVGQYLGYAGSVFDIHDKKMAEFRIESEREKFETMFMNSPAGLALVRGPTFIFEKCNSKFLDLVSSKNLIGRPFKDALPELEAQPYIEIMTKVFETGENFHEKEFLTKGVHRSYFDLTYSRVLDGEGHPYGVTIHAIEITDMVLARQRIESLQTLSADFAASLTVRDVSNALLKQCSHVFGAYCGIVSSLLPGSSDFEVVASLDGAENLLDLSREVFISGKILFLENKAIIPLLIKDRIIAVLALGFSGPPLFPQDHKNHLLHMASQCAQAFERALLYEHELKRKKILEEVVRSRDEFLSIASHELKTPLTSLQLQAQIHKKMIQRKREEVYSPQVVEHFVTQTEKQTLRLSRLVDDMLDVSRIRTGHLTLKKEPFDLLEMIEEVVCRLQNQFLNSHYEIPKFLTSEHVTGTWDRLRIEQVTINLLTNAIRYGSGNPITVSVEVKENMARLTVADQGYGISKDNQEMIFNRFERAVSADEVSGLGLGLFITKQIVSAHGGHIEVQSELGKGSEFIVELPVSNYH